MVKLVDYYFYWILVELLAHPKIIFSPQGSRQKEALVLSSSCDWMTYILYSLDLVSSCVIFGSDIVSVICLGTDDFCFIR